jgi:hypothetical protein
MLEDVRSCRGSLPPFRDRDGARFELQPCKNHCPHRAGNAAKNKISEKLVENWFRQFLEVFENLKINETVMEN